MAFVSKDATQTGKGLAWRVRWRDPEGKSREEWFYGSRRAALKRAATLEADLHRGEYVNDKRGRTTFREVADEWLATRTKARPETVAAYRRQLDQWILPTFGSRKVSSIHANDIGDFVNYLKTAPMLNGRPGSLRPATIKRIFGPLKAVLLHALDEGYIKANPARRIELPTEETMGVDTFEGTALEWRTVERVASEAASVDPLFGLIVRFLARTGLRASELSGLRVGDYRPGWIGVDRTAQRDGRAPDGIRYGKPKSKTSRRSVPLGGDIEAELVAYLADHPRKAEPDAPLFPTRFAGGEHDRALRKADPFNWSRPIDPGNFRRRVFDPACAAAGVGKIRLHDLRVTCGSLMLAAGIDLFHVSRYLGHSSPDLTARVYAKVLVGSAEQDAARFAAYCGGVEDGTVTPIRRVANRT